ncbi:hypothetical protein RND81_11G116000 [Saponaria officinalis]|uniref:ATP-dependent DNA helicase n=1 Tax=Saponaria officinalis TaxID=3572 RepID=A0AAW1HJV5_SAPOF
MPLPNFIVVVDEFPYYPTDGIGTSRRDKQRHSQIDAGRWAPRQRRGRRRECMLHKLGRHSLVNVLSLPDTHQCLECNAQKFAYESAHFCCGGGAIKLLVNEYPQQLIRYARLYNNLFAFSSLGRNFDAQNQKGIYVFKLHGQIYHHITQMNPYARFFRSLRELNINKNTQIIINKNIVLDQRVYNAPTSDEVVVIWTENSSSSESNSPHILVTGKANDSHRIKNYYGCYDPLQYPLLFPYGECGWNQGLLKIPKKHSSTTTQQNEDLITDMQLAETFLEDANQRPPKGVKHVSAREYYCYKFQNRPQNMILRAGRCLQQYIVDMYVKVENTRLDFFRNNQETIRGELYHGILDTLQARENCAANVGRRVILPPTFLGGPRDMKKRYVNAMSLVQKYGKPDLFVTMTCNAACPKIKQELAHGERAQNRPDLVARVFQAKSLALKKLIMEQHMFGEVSALIFVVEFQKGGLPHAHFLIILKPAYKLKAPEDFNKFVRAEIPFVHEIHLKKTVLKHMMHGPMWPHESKLPVYATSLEHGKVQAVKYLYKNVYKGHDKIAFNVVQKSQLQALDEIKHYQSGRWVSPCEAAWRIYGFDLFEMHPPVMPLPIHLPNMQTLQMRPYEQLKSVVLSDKRTRTPLTEFFRINAMTNGRKSLYGDFTETYRWDKKLKTWLERKNKLIVIGRLAFVATSEGERYYLRLLLLNVRGPKSFEDQLNVEGYTCATFHEAALKRRLQKEDDAVDLCLKEACEVQMPSSLRRLFAMVLTFCQPSDPGNLWQKYFNSLSEGFKRQFPDAPVKYLETMGKTLKSSGLDYLTETQDEEVHRTRDITDTLDAPIPQQCIDCRKTFLIVLPIPTSEHSWFKIPIDLEMSLACDASMARKENVESLDMLLRDLCNPNMLFGGKILPIVPKKSTFEVIGATLFRLTENIRAREDPYFLAFLLSLGNGELQIEDHGFVTVPEAITRQVATDISDPLYIFMTRAILTPMNDDRFPGMVVSPHNLILKENCPVILLRNILPSFGLCNGTRLLCYRFFPNLIECISATGQNKGEHLCFAMTINKSQGHTLNQVAVFLPQPSKVSTKVKKIVSFDMLRLAGII